MKPTYQERSAAYAKRPTVSARYGTVQHPAPTQPPSNGPKRLFRGLINLFRKCFSWFTPLYVSRRPAYFISAIVMFVSVIAATGLGDWVMTRPAHLSAAELQLTGESRDDVAEYLRLDDKTKAYNFEVPETQDSAEASVHVGRVDDVYSASFPANASDGVTVTDKATKIAVTVKPNFFTAKARKQEQGQIVYNSTRGKLTYTLKYNGLKEDIILDKPQGDNLTFNFDLVLPNGVVARLDDQGNIGIYSADPTLFGEISFGSDSDRERVEKARQNGEKSHLVMTIPYPIVKDANGTEYSDKAHFKLGEQTTESSTAKPDTSLPAEVQAQMQTKSAQNVYPLTIESYGLKDLAYPISIDPTIQTTSNSDFLKGNMVGTEIDPDDSTRIQRSSLSGGALTAWTTDTGGNFAGARSSHATVAYNGYLYVVGTSTVYYAPIDTAACVTASATCVGSWTATSSLHTTTINPGFTAYNGYVYIVGGDTGAAAMQTVQSAKINNNGTLGTWATTTSLNTARTAPGVSAYNGRIYATGGASNLSNTVTYTSSEYGLVGANGTITSWTTDTGGDFTTTRSGHASPIYNGYIYVMGGVNSTDHQSSVYLALLNADGSIGTWRSATSLPANRSGASYGVSNGYIYLMGGCSTGSCSTYLSSSLYAQVNADGSLGSWLSATSINGARWYSSSAIYDGTIFVTGGCTTGTCASPETTTQYARIKSAGELATSTWTAGSSFNTSVNSPSTAVYNGFIYKAGGGNGTAPLNNVEYAPLNTNGSIGTWTATNPMGTARIGFALIADQGYLYALGGCTGFLAGACTGATTSTEAATIANNGSVNNNWTAKSSMTQARWYINSVIHNGYMYAGFGCNAALSTCYASVERAQITAAGTLGTFSADAVSGVTIGTGAVSSRIEVWQGIMYWVLSGDNTLRYTTINTSTGSVAGTWTNFGTTFTAKTRMGTALWNGVLYILGGSASTTVQAINLNSSGIPTGSWRSMSALPANTEATDFAVSNGHIYGVEVSDSSALSTNTYYIPINNGGTGQSTWTESANIFVSGTGNKRYEHGATVLNGYLYMAGGCGNDLCSSTRSGMEYAPISADGSIGTWTVTTTEVPGAAGTRSMGFVGYDGYLYFIGGSNTSTNRDARTYYVAPDSGGNVTASWVEDTDSLLVHGTSQASLVMNGNTIYLVGGVDEDGGGVTNDVQYAQIQSNHTLNAWQQDSSNEFTTARRLTTTAVYGGRLYVMGGCTVTGACTTASDILADVQVATINSGGDLGSFSNLANVPLGAYSAKAYALNGFMYFIGGEHPSDTAYGERTYVSPILSDGSIGAWQAQPSTFGTGDSRRGHGLAYSNGRFYVTGGRTSGGTGLTTAEYGTIQSIPRTGSYSRLVDFGSAVKPTKLITRGSKRTGTTVALAYSNTDESATTLMAGTGSSDITYAGANAVTLALGSGVTTSRYFWLRYTIDESQSAVFPDYSNESTITDFDLYFTANPGQRLRGGRSFTGQQDRGLDAAPQ